ncbi:unnamed protein product [Rhizopus microsporus]
MKQVMQSQKNTAIKNGNSKDAICFTVQSKSNRTRRAIKRGTANQEMQAARIISDISNSNDAKSSELLQVANA